MSDRDSQHSPVRSIRCWPMFLIALIGCGIFFVVQVRGWSLIRPGIDIQIFVGLFNLAVYIWVRAWSNLRRRAQISAIVFLLIAQAILLVMLRLDGFAGDGRIVVQWRWTPTPEERLAEFSTRTTSDLSRANLAQTFDTDSPGFRGADRAGLYGVPVLQLDWQSHPPRELWRHPVGRGWSSFAVVGAYCVTQEQRENLEAVVCYELGTGNEVWCHLDATRFEEYTSGPGPRATPTMYEGRVYTYGATGTLNCLDGSTGSVVWTRQIGPDVSPSLFGDVSSPLVYGQRVFVSPGGAAGSLVALDCLTGDLLWSEGSRKPGYSSPHLFLRQNMAQVLVFDAIGLHGHDAATGATRWSFPWGDNSDEQVNVG
ncbi:MAG: PQQ-binding-like beta-propeller repeat protein [Planctomycetaceae bacterium]